MPAEEVGGPFAGEDHERIMEVRSCLEETPGNLVDEAFFRRKYRGVQMTLLMLPLSTYARRASTSLPGYTCRRIRA
jgi:hypothetical protein